MRESASLLLAGMAALLLSMLIFLPFGILRDVANNQLRYQEFRKIEIYVNNYVMEYGKFPSDGELEIWAKNPSYSPVYSIRGDPTGCPEYFSQDADDKFIIFFWEGDFFECFSSPSGRVTMPQYFSDYVQQPGFVKFISVIFLIAVVLGWFAWWVRPRSNRLSDPKT